MNQIPGATTTPTVTRNAGAAMTMDTMTAADAGMIMNTNMAMTTVTPADAVTTMNTVMTMDAAMTTNMTAADVDMITGL